MKYSSGGCVVSSVPWSRVPGAVTHARGVSVAVSSGVDVNVGLGVLEGVDVKDGSVGEGVLDEEQAVMMNKSEQRIMLLLLAWWVLIRRIIPTTESRLYSE